MMSFLCLTCKRGFGSQQAVQQHCDALGHSGGLECEHCSFTCEVEDELDDHNKMKHERYECSLCNKVFWGLYAINQHNEAKHAHCNICNITFYKGDDFLSHDLNLHHKFDCVPCDRTFYGKEAYDQHQQAKHNHLCKMCSAYFWSPASLEQHISAYHNLRCAQCGISYKHKSAYDKHLLTASHAEAVRRYNCATRVAAPVNPGSEQFTQAINTLDSRERRASATPKPQFFKCEHCFSKSFESQNDLLLHQVSAHIIKAAEMQKPTFNLPSQQEPPKEIKIYVCHECEAEFASMALILSHRAMWHPPNPLEQAKTALFTCETCGGRFDSMTSLQDHRTLWHMNPCNKCFGLFFDDAATLQQHKEECHIFKCLECPGLFFTRHLALIEHEAVHHQPRSEARKIGNDSSVQTSERDKSFGFDTSMHYPTSTQLSPRPAAEKYTPHLIQKDANAQKVAYNCHECREVYNTDAELRSHWAISPYHNPQPMECYECDLKFQNVLKLHAHMELKPHKYTRGVYCLVEVNREVAAEK